MTMTTHPPRAMGPGTGIFSPAGSVGKDGGKEEHSSGQGKQGRAVAGVPLAKAILLPGLAGQSAEPFLCVIRAEGNVGAAVEFDGLAEQGENGLIGMVFLSHDSMLAVPCSAVQRAGADIPNVWAPLLAGIASVDGARSREQSGIPPAGVRSAHRLCAAVSADLHATGYGGQGHTMRRHPGPPHEIFYSNA